MPNASGFEPQPLGRHERAGKARRGRPGSQETSLRPQSLKPSWKGVADPYAQVPRRPGGRYRVARCGAWRARAANVGVRVEGDARHAGAAHDRDDLAGLVLEGRRPRPPVLVDERGRRARAAPTAGDWAGASGASLRRLRRAGRSRASTTPSSSAPEGSYWTFWHNYRYCVQRACARRRAAGGRRRPVLPELLRRGAATSRGRCGSRSAPASARPGRPFDVQGDRVRLRVRRVDADHDRGAGRGRDRHRRRPDVHRGARRRGLGDGRVAQPGGRAGDEGRLHPLGDRSSCASDCADGPAAAGGGGADGAGHAPRRPRPWPPCATAPCTRGGGRRGCCAGRVTADPSGLHSVKLRLTRRAGGKCSYFSGRQRALPPDALRARLVLPHRRPGRVVLPAAEAARARALRARGQGHRRRVQPRRGERARASGCADAARRPRARSRSSPCPLRRARRPST